MELPLGKEAQVNFFEGATPLWIPQKVGTGGVLGNSA